MIPVFYRPEMSVADNASFSPSAGKPALAVADWQACKMPIELHSFEPVTQQQLMLVHDERYVLDVFNGDEPNGFGNTDPAVAQACLYTCGSMVAAAEHAVRHDAFVCSPTSGFHHAGRNFGGGFCTFNGLALAAHHIVTKLDRDVAIIDCDQHDGDGTRDIIEGRGGWTKRVTHSNMGQHRFTRVQPFYIWLEREMGKARAEDRVILYQAGADAHIRDPLGGFLYTNHLAERDGIVFYMAAMFSQPVVWNLAGGYLRDDNGSIKPVLEIHRNTMLQCARAKGIPLRSYYDQVPG